MREGLVGFSHLVHVFTALDRSATLVGGVNQLVREALTHGLAGTTAGELNDPTDRESLTALRTNLNRYLVVGTTEAPSGSRDPLDR